jgi:hypothetical protein
VTADREGQLRPGELARLHSELALRLRPVCADMPPSEFDALVREVARVKVKYDLPASDRL